VSAVATDFTDKVRL